MATFPCPSVPSLCEQTPNPLTPYSAETVDGPTFLSAKWSADAPLLNKNFNNYPCVAFAQSQTSQELAEIAAIRGALACTNPCSEIFSNTEQTARFACPNGSLCSFTVPADSFTALDQLSADRMALSIALATVQAHSICMGSLVGGTVCLGMFVQAEVFILGNSGPFIYSLTGTLPPGMVMSTSGNEVLFSGVPTQTGTYHVTLTATNQVGVTTSQPLTLTVITITTGSSLANGFFGTPYSVALTVINPNSSPTNWTIASGSLPPGLTLNASTGVIGGSPLTGGTFNFTAEVEVDGGICSKDFSIFTQLINWDTMVWTNVLAVPGGGAGGIAVAQFSGALFNVQAKGNGSPDAKVEALGTLTYTGPSVNCRVVVTVLATAANFMGFFVHQDLVQKLFIQASDLTVGTHIFPFTVDAGTATQIIVKGESDIGDPARLWAFGFDGNLRSYNGQFGPA